MENLSKPKFKIGDIICAECTDSDDMPLICKGKIKEVVKYANGKYAYEVILDGTRFLQRHWQEDGQYQNGVMLMSPVYAADTK